MLTWINPLMKWRNSTLTWINMNMKMMKTLFALGLCLALGACANNAYEAIFDPDQPSLQSVYGRQTQNQNHTGYAQGELDGYTRTAVTEIENLFPELPNPRLVTYVFPHITKSGAPIPGYSTAFYLYNHNNVFALPGEDQ